MVSWLSKLVAAAQRAAQNPSNAASHLRCAVTTASTPRPLPSSAAPRKHTHTHTHTTACGA
eukprot:1408979-Prymnesium_polylepis.1